MIDPVELGQRLKERRKHRGFTQEQLGQDLFVSPQAVSKWETGESLPDIGTIPALCKALGTSSDDLLGISSEPDIETLGVKLARSIGNLKDSEERHAALMTALGLLISTSVGGGNGDRNISYQLSDSGLTGFSFWSSIGLVCFAGGQSLEKETPSTHMLDILRTLLSTDCWPIASRLLGGPKNWAALSEVEPVGSTQALKGVLGKLIAAGILVQDKEGYRLEENYGLILTGMIKALCMESAREGIGSSIFVNRQT